MSRNIAGEEVLNVAAGPGLRYAIEE